MKDHALTAEVTPAARAVSGSGRLWQCSNRVWQRLAVAMAKCGSANVACSCVFEPCQVLTWAFA